jgi:hypothetical protein
MINGLGWSVGVGSSRRRRQPIDILTPDVIGFKLFGELRRGENNRSTLFAGRMPTPKVVGINSSSLVGADH